MYFLGNLQFVCQILQLNLRVQLQINENKKSRIDQSFINLNVIRSYEKHLQTERFSVDWPRMFTFVHKRTIRSYK